MKRIWVLARKELSAYFGSPVALIFLGLFLVFTLVAFFWVGGFFARNIADVRLLFRSMPALLLFLVAALTMRQWSEEQRSGTLEVLLTLPVRRAELVLGKFLAMMLLVALALALTLFLPITVSILGDLDWGPVVGGYLAALLMAAAYVALGLFVSSLTDNQIVALIVTVVIGGLLYVAGTTGVTSLTGESLDGVLQAIGTGSRFQSIERGVLDLRDLVYYLSLAALFLFLNVVSLDQKRWSRGKQMAPYRNQVWLSVSLVVINLLVLNLWLYPMGSLRADMTADREYSLSDVTKDLIGNLQEPLLLRAYLSQNTHPLLAPLIPTVRDMLSEYEIASGGRVQVEMVDPRDDEELEEEASQVYGIRPTPFRIADVYETSVVNSYFDILVRYGDQHVTLSVDDLIEVEPQAGGDLDVRLRNPEYTLTRAIKKVVYGFQDLASVFASFEEPVRLTAYVTPKLLPAGMEGVPATVEVVARELEAESGGKFVYQFIDPDAAGSPVTRNALINSMGLTPFAPYLFASDSEAYYLHLVLEIEGEAQVMYPAADMTEAEIRTGLEAALKRSAPGFLKTVGLWLPTLQPEYDMFGNVVQPISSWNRLQAQLQQDYTVQQVDLSSGRVPDEIDVLVLIAPQNLTDLEKFAMDQYLMRGGAVVAAAGNYILPSQNYGTGLTVSPVEGGMGDLLDSYGVVVSQTLALDPQNEPLPVQVARNVGGMQVYEIQELSYPYFVDVRSAGMDKESSIVSSLNAVTLHWASPVLVDEAKNEDREVHVLLQSTEDSWLSAAVDVQPQPDQYPPYGFAIGEEQASWPLAVSIRGSFESYFKDKASPFEATETVTETEVAAMGTIESSPESARLVVIGSTEFIDDVILDLSQSLAADRYLNNLALVQNAVDWSVEDEDLLSIRTRGSQVRLLKPLDDGQKAAWMWANFAVALLALVAISAIWYLRRRNEQPMFVDVSDEPEAEGGSHD